MNETAVITAILGLIVAVFGIFFALFFINVKIQMLDRRYDFTQQQIKDWVSVMGMIIKELSKLNTNDDKLLRSLRKYEDDEQPRH